jgi:hypothetical protein
LILPENKVLSNAEANSAFAGEENSGLGQEFSFVRLKWLISKSVSTEGMKRSPCNAFRDVCFWSFVDKELLHTFGVPFFGVPILFVGVLRVSSCLYELFKLRPSSASRFII